MQDYTLLEDEHFIVINKPPGIPVQPDKTGDVSIIKQLSESNGKQLHLVHRLDRPASGVMVFAKTTFALRALNKQFQERTVAKVYWAVVKNKPISKKGSLLHYLRKNEKSNRSVAFNKPLHHTQKAELDYEVLNHSDNYQLLEILLKTGRHHQIRAQLSAIDCPIKGDVKYGFRRGNKDRSIHLHSRKLEFNHPETDELVSVQANTPEDVVWTALCQFIV